MTDTKWLTVTAVAQVVVLLVTFVLFLSNSKAGRKKFILLGLLLSIALTADLIGNVGALIYRKNVNIVHSVSYLFILPLYLLFYKSKLSSKQVGSIINFVIVIFLVFGLVNLFFIQKPFGINSYTRSFGTISMISISITYFYFLIKELPTESITRLPMFWVNTAVLIYYSGTFFLYLAADYLVTVLNGNLINEWTIHNFMGILYYSMLSAAFLLNRSAHLQTTAAPSPN